MSSDKKQGKKKQQVHSDEREYKFANRFYAFPAFDSNPNTDPMGSYTGRPTETYEVPVQDADDL